MTEENERLVLDFYTKWTRCDAEEMNGYFAAEGTYEDRSIKLKAQGHEQLRAFWERSAALAARARVVFSIEAVNVVSKGNLVLTERLDHFQSPAGHLAVPVASVIELQGGKITHMREYWDRGSSGLPEPPPN